jgi:hypothetical protein
LGKIFSIILAGRLRDWSLIHNVLLTLQTRFWRRTEILLTFHNLNRYIYERNRGQTFSCFMDLEKFVIRSVEVPYGINEKNGVE